MKKTTIALFVGLAVVLGIGIYWKLGGFNSVSFSIEDREDIRLLGISYRGTPQDPVMVETFQEIEKVISQYPQSRLHTIYYIEPAGKRDTLHVFVGVEYLEEIAGKSSFELKEIPCKKVIVAKIQSHKSVMPSPESVKQQINDFAENEGFVLQGVLVDKIISKSQVDVIAPLEM